jgi:hypothetical protein
MEEDHDTGRREDVKLRFPFVDGNATRCTRVRFAAGPGPNAPRLVSLKNASVNESDQSLADGRFVGKWIATTTDRRARARLLFHLPAPHMHTMAVQGRTKPDAIGIGRLLRQTSKPRREAQAG